jgi:hypothetical protein
MAIELPSEHSSGRLILKYPFSSLNIVVGGHGDGPPEISYVMLSYWHGTASNNEDGTEYPLPRKLQLPPQVSALVSLQIAQSPQRHTSSTWISS